MKKIIFLSFVLACLCAIALCGYQILKPASDYREGDKTYQLIAEDSVELLPMEADVIPEESTTKEKKLEIPVSVDWNTLPKEVDAWIYIDGIEASYPVAHDDGSQFYLHHLIDGTYNFEGTIFSAVENDRDFADMNTVIYGHNMNNGSMFGRLKEYKDVEFAKKNPYFWIIRRNKAYRCRICCAATTTISDSLYTIYHMPGKAFSDWVKHVNNMSQVEYQGVDGQKYMVLSTCYQSGTDYRTVVVGQVDAVARLQ